PNSASQVLAWLRRDGTERRYAPAAVTRIALLPCSPRRRICKQMARGITPRQPARTGRQDRVARTLLSAKAAPKRSRVSKNGRGSKDARVGTGAPVSLPRAKPRGP